MRPPKVVILDPQLCAVLHVLEPVEQCPGEKLLLDRLPEPLDLSLRLRVVRLRPDVPDLHPDHFLVELRMTPPTRVLPTVVRQYFRRRFVLCHPTAEHLKNVVRLLRHVQPEAGDEPGEVINEPYQIHTLFLPRDDTDVRLPHQVRTLDIGTILLGSLILRLPFRLGRVLCTRRH